MKKLIQLTALTLVFAAVGCLPSAKADYFNYDTAFYGGQYPGYRANGTVAVVSAVPSYYAMPIVSAIPAPAPWINTMPVHNWVIPTRFADVTVDEVVQGPMRHYTLVVNGRPILQVNNQTTTLRASQIYALGGEDALILSTQSTQPGCTTRHYLITVSDGMAHTSELGHCAASYEADITNNALFVTFSDDINTWSTRNVWRYESGQLREM